MGPPHPYAWRALIQALADEGVGKYNHAQLAARPNNFTTAGARVWRQLLQDYCRLIADIQAYSARWAPGDSGCRAHVFAQETGAIGAELRRALKSAPG